MGVVWVSVQSIGYDGAVAWTGAAGRVLQAFGKRWCRR